MLCALVARCGAATIVAEQPSFAVSKRAAAVHVAQRALSLLRDCYKTILHWRAAGCWCAAQLVVTEQPQLPEKIRYKCVPASRLLAKL
jgi:hypothetical protein